MVLRVLTVVDADLKFSRGFDLNHSKFQQKKSKDFMIISCLMSYIIFIIVIRIVLR